MLIGVFDSGIGGEAMATKLHELLPEAKIVSVNDHEHVPYGSRPEAAIIDLTVAAVQPLLAMKCDAIVIACNTATTVAIRTLRERYPTVLFIGIEPMVKPAAHMTRTGHIAVCATPGTLHSARYQELKDTWAKGVEVIEPDCSLWASAIENNESNTLDIESIVSSLIKQDVDVIVLGCTHYHWIKRQIADTAGPNVTVLEPTDAIARRITSLIT
jgi:glutamate racemase